MPSVDVGEGERRGKSKCRQKKAAEAKRSSRRSPASKTFHKILLAVSAWMSAPSGPLIALGLVALTRETWADPIGAAHFD